MSDTESATKGKTAKADKPLLTYKEQKLHYQMKMYKQAKEHNKLMRDLFDEIKCVYDAIGSLEDSFVRGTDCIATEVSQLK